MRDQLRPFEGQLVFVEGRLTEASHRRDKHYFLINRPNITPWDAKSAVDLTKPVTHVDHLWIEMLPGQVEMMNRIFGLTRIRYYTRSDGSVDLGCEPLYSLFDFDSYQASFDAQYRKQHGRAIDEHFSHIEVALKALALHGKTPPGADGPTFAFSRVKSFAAMQRYFKKWEGQVLDAKANYLKAQANAKGARRPCRSAGSFMDLLR